MIKKYGLGYAYSGYAISKYYASAAQLIEDVKANKKQTARYEQCLEEFFSAQKVAAQISHVFSAAVKS